MLRARTLLGPAVAAGDGRLGAPHQPRLALSLSGRRLLGRGAASSETRLTWRASLPAGAARATSLGSPTRPGLGGPRARRRERGREVRASAGSPAPQRPPRSVLLRVGCASRGTGSAAGAGAGHSAVAAWGGEDGPRVMKRSARGSQPGKSPRAAGASVLGKPSPPCTLSAVVKANSSRWPTRQRPSGVATLRCRLETASEGEVCVQPSTSDLVQ
uniref:uncharacterized protein LOC123461544 n=1 Tax=Jaculus jaculus TaxID=51337 RepID=UPI001E1B375E|nr:uncharacterized protein LOC123461544 [Jaculus jaculus]